FKFMKSISMRSQGIPALYWVCRWQMGRSRMERPEIHIFAGEKVCIQVNNPMQSGLLFASLHSPKISSGVVTTPLKTRTRGIVLEAFRPSTICLEFEATSSRVSSPYRCWLPVTNQISLVVVFIVLDKVGY